MGSYKCQWCLWQDMLATLLTMIRLKINERLQPIEDPLIRRCLDIAEQGRNSDSKLRKLLAQASSHLDKMIFERLLWTPTGCLEGGSTNDYPSYLITEGNVDIFFPTDFTLLKRLDHHVAREKRFSSLARKRMLNFDIFELCHQPFEGILAIWVQVTLADFMKRFASTSITQL